MSFFIAGLGQIAKGQFGRALAIWALLFVLFWLGVSLFLPFFAMPVVWIWSIYDAYTFPTARGPSSSL